jgi:hypothetical protein
MTPNRRISITAGALFLIATAASLIGTALAPPLTGPDLLREVAAHSGAMATAQLLALVAAGCSLGIAIALYAVLHGTHPTLAVGGVAFRGIEAVCYAIGAIALLALLSTATSAGPATSAGQPAGAAAVATALVAAAHRAGIAAVSAFVVGALMYYAALYRTRLVPRWLSGWGLAALPFMAAACLLALFADRPVSDYVVLALPLGLQEIIFGLWLLVKGFSPARPETPDTPAPRPSVVLTP